MTNEISEMKLEVVLLPVADVDRAKAFYVDQVGFNCDHDSEPSTGMRIVQLTPPGSACSIVIGIGVPAIDEMTVGSIRGLHLVVKDIAISRDRLIKNGVKVDEVVDMGGVKFAGFSDPDGNSWTLQEIPASMR